MGASKSCRRQLLAKGEYGTVESCRCGMVHLNVGPLTLRLDHGALKGLAETLADAQTALNHAQQRARDDYRLFMGDVPNADQERPHDPDLH